MNCFIYIYIFVFVFFGEGGIFFGGGNISQLWYNNTHGTFFMDEFFRIIRIIWQREYFLTFSLRTGCFDPSVFKLFKIFD